jgi:hypothetical protein
MPSPSVLPTGSLRGISRDGPILNRRAACATSVRCRLNSVCYHLHPTHPSTRRHYRGDLIRPARAADETGTCRTARNGPRAQTRVCRARISVNDFERKLLDARLPGGLSPVKNTGWNSRAVGIAAVNECPVSERPTSFKSARELTNSPSRLAGARTRNVPVDPLNRPQMDLNR